MHRCTVTITLMERADVSVYLRTFSSLIARTVADVEHINERRLLYDRLQIGGCTTCFLLYKGHKLVGAIHLYDIVAGRHAYVYCWIHEHYWSRGIFSRTIREVARRVYRTRGIRALFATISRDNSRSMRAFLRAGFAGLSIDQEAYTMLLRIR